MMDIQTGLFKVLDNAVRRQVISCLLEHGELRVTDILGFVPLAQSAMSQHLALMRQAGVVQTRRFTTSIYYRIDGRFDRVLSDLKREGWLGGRHP